MIHDNTNPMYHNELFRCIREQLYAGIPEFDDKCGNLSRTFFLSSDPEIYINPADTIGIPEFMPNYKGKVCFLEDGEILDLGGRILEIVFTPGHTPGSTTFVDKDAAYGFSGDSFGSGNLLLGVDFSTLISTCKKMSAVIEKYDIKYLYPGHYFGMNKETPQRVKDMITMSEDILSGKVQGEPNPSGMLGLDRVYTNYGVRINYKEESMK